MTPSIAVITPSAGETISALLPTALAGIASEWEWYHRCLSAVAEVRYLGLNEWEDVSGYDAVLVHEALEAVTAGRTVSALSKIRDRNAKLIWIEPHARSVFRAPVFEPEFFDVVDVVAKYQLVDYEELLLGLRSAENNLAPWALYGHSSIDGFYSDPRLFALPTSPDTLRRHLASDLSGRYGDQIVPLMRLFTFTGPESHYARQSPSRQPRIMKEAQVGVAIGQGGAAGLSILVAGLLAQAGLDVKAHTSRVRAAATSEAFVGLGPVHLDAGAADVLRFETLAVLPEDDRYLIWDDVYRPYETYLPLSGFGELLRTGGRVIDGQAAHRIAGQLASDLADKDLRARILEGQRAAHGLLADPRFVVRKLGIELPPTASPQRAREATGPRAVRTAVPDAPPRRVGSISTDQVSVVIQGPIGRGEMAERVIEGARRLLPGAEVIVSTWQGERALDLDVDRRIENPDPGAPWFTHDEYANNTVRLRVSTTAGLNACTRPYSLKLRSDTPLSGTGFLEVFQSYPQRGDALRLLRDRIVVINRYCYDPRVQPHGLFFVADTVQFGRTEDLRAAWARPPDDEPENTIWFESHPRPDPDLLPGTHFRYAAEQLFWLGFLRNHVEVPFEHVCDRNPEAWLLHERSLANNVVIVDPDEFGVEVPSFADRPPQPGAVYTRTSWYELYERHCLDAPVNLTADPLEGARPFVVLVDAEQLLASDEMLRAYADAMSGSDLATLAIDATRMPATIFTDRIRAMVDRCGLAERQDIELCAIVGTNDAARRDLILSATHALYRREPGAVGELPVFTPGSLEDLRNLVEASARSSAQATGLVADHTG